MEKRLSVGDRVAKGYNYLSSKMTRREALMTAAGAIGGAVLTIAGVAIERKESASNGEKERKYQIATGIDISYPQGMAEKYDGQQYDFVIVGVNGGKPTEPNSYLPRQLRVAKELTKNADPTKTGISPLQLYINTANPADFFNTPDVKKSPESDGVDAGYSPYGMCDGTDSKACMYRYGQQRAQESMEMFMKAAAEAGVSAIPADYIVWLDIETSNTWREKVREGEDAKDSNRAVLEGMVAYLESINVQAGLYAARSHWEELIGNDVGMESNLYYLPTWIAAGSVSEKEAKERLSQGNLQPFTAGGKVVMIQQLEGESADAPDAQDRNYALALAA